MIRPLLLHLANSSPPVLRSEFYAFKNRLLSAHGTPDGDDVQEIIKPCYGNYGGRFGDWAGCTKNEHCRCGGTGFYARRRYRLQRWKWGRYTFHIPMDGAPLPSAVATITGYVSHRRYGRVSNEAALWLYLLSGEWKLLWRSMTVSCCLGWYLWPMLLIQRVMMSLNQILNRHSCIFCRRRFFTWGSGWCACPRCRRRERSQDVDDAIPF